MQEAMKRAVDIAYRAKGVSEKLRQEGFIRRGDIVRETRERILSLETENYRGEGGLIFSSNRPIFGSAVHRPITLRQPEKRVA
jgi:hypothetical protein